MKYLSFTIFLSLIVGFLLVPTLLFAQPATQPVITSGEGSINPGSQSTAAVGPKIENPLGVDDPRVIVGNVIRALLGIAGSLALLVFIFGGFTWVISGGNEEKVRKGKAMIMWASLGLAVIFFSYALVTFVIGALAGSS
ncbi:MAG: hypothetical protein A2840_01635 [Candidatus Buchananbacteria bacterium RIFCSPHIGHO2_01_FULL_47_11b]|uniref:Uncharacterized protein n=1 Tax=Candidatus Buchananbacteria bacterium RIFCSPHIGHO2_01_FULL_47_11b TaxID=1797537 RepID=A0A1G1Y4W9_9BACT|nr:MAG: hypothetical protein A2840_01635 [Candidatus Buchananbacteria bacterium RIFCSPHIGHO2_01_FULL_47_11b]